MLDSCQSGFSLLDTRVHSPDPRKLNIAYWNVQHLFGIDASPIASELGISAINGWDRRALEGKLHAVADHINSMFDGHGPDLLGISELENREVGDLLLRVIGRDDYRLLVADDPHIAATDTALIYSTRCFHDAPIQTVSHRVHHRFPTCDILEAELKLLNGDAGLTVMVHHWPSRQESDSEAFRQTVASYTARLVDHHLKLQRPEFLELRDTEVSRHQLEDRWNRNLLLMGTFNEAPWAPALHKTLNAGFSLQQSRELVPAMQKGLPSWRAYSACRPPLFNSAWRLLGKPEQQTVLNAATGNTPQIYDQMLLSRGLMTGQSGIQVACDKTGVPEFHCLPTPAVNDTHPANSVGGQETAYVSDRLAVGLSLHTDSKAAKQATSAVGQHHS